jgi:cysteine desulfurase/selenocysteine lyase
MTSKPLIEAFPLPPGEGQGEGGAPRRSFDVERIRRDFPGLAISVHGRPLAYLDNAATAQKPEAVLAAEAAYYRESCSNVHRGVHALAEKATALYESSRRTVASFLGATRPEEIVFTRGTTEAINLVARSFLRPRLGAGDEVLLTVLEHHSNIVPWQLVCEEAGARLRVVPIDDSGELRLDELAELLSERTRLLAFGHVSNALGTINPVAELISAARQRGVPVLIDGAQAVPHFPVDVAALGCDFYAFSGHKLFGPTGIGALWAKHELLDAMPPYQGGGDMIRSVSFAGTEFADPPQRFEAGTPNIAGAAGLAAAIGYLGALDRVAAAGWEDALLAEASGRLCEIPGLRVVGTAARKAPVLSFVLDGVHPHDLGTILDREGVAVRAGHHCAQPLMERLGLPATVRASFAFYNTPSEVDALVRGVAKAREIFG